MGHSNPVTRFLLPNAFFTALSGFEGLHVAPKKFVVASNNSFFLAKGNLVDFNKRKTPTNVFFRQPGWLMSILKVNCETVCLTKFDIRQAETHLLPVVRNLSTFGLFG